MKILTDKACLVLGLLQLDGGSRRWVGPERTLSASNFFNWSLVHPVSPQPTIPQKLIIIKWPHHPTFDLCTGPFCVKSRIGLSRRPPQFSSVFAALSTPPPIAAIIRPQQWHSKLRRESSISNTPRLRGCIRPCWNDIIRALGV